VDHKTRIRGDPWSSREAAAECSPRPKPWVENRGDEQAPEGRKKIGLLSSILEL
jgi:hypothetical protein